MDLFRIKVFILFIGLHWSSLGEWHVDRDLYTLPEETMKSGNTTR